MAKTVETQATNTQNGKTLKKVSATQIKLADQPAGFELEGIYVGMATRDWVDKEGEVKPMFTLIIENSKGERVKCLADAGLRTALEDALVQAGDWFKAVKGEKQNIGKGRTMNTWDVFQFVNEN